MGVCFSSCSEDIIGFLEIATAALCVLDFDRCRKQRQGYGDAEAFVSVLKPEACQGGAGLQAHLFQRCIYKDVSDFRLCKGNADAALELPGSCFNWTLGHLRVHLPQKRSGELKSDMDNKTNEAVMQGFLIAMCLFSIVHVNRDVRHHTVKAAVASAYVCFNETLSRLETMRQESACG